MSAVGSPFNAAIIAAIGNAPTTVTDLSAYPAVRTKVEVFNGHWVLRFQAFEAQHAFSLS